LFTVSFTVTEYDPGVLAAAGEDTAIAVPDDIKKTSNKAIALLLAIFENCKNCIVPPETRKFPLILQF
jgi:hypothetical protein